MKYGSLFTGIGGFDLALDRAGFECAWQVEINPYRRKVLEKHWPDVERFEDVREVGKHNLARVDLICGGDPCQAHSCARGIHGKGKARDMSGEFLRVVRGLRPRWVLRENVPAPTCYDFASGLGGLGYSYIILEINSRDFTAQSRCRRFVVGYLGGGAAIVCAFPESQSDNGHSPPVYQSEPYTYCLTTHPYRLEQRDNYIFEFPAPMGIRVPTIRERERLMGFVDGWTSGISDRQRIQALGDAVTVNVIEWIATRIRGSE